MGVIECSMGRDSLALIEVMSHELDNLLVLFVDPGGTLPEIEETVKYVENRVPHFFRLRTDSNAWINANGMPFDVVPVWHTVMGLNLAGNNAPAISSSLECCFQNVMRPMHEFCRAIGAKKIYRGQRNAERMKSPLRSGAKDDDIELVFPLENWSDEDVNNYLAERNIPLPEWYQYGNKGFDCWWCTGFVEDSKGLHRYLKNKHPDKWAIVDERIRAAKAKVASEMAMME
jgi:phosphoadenosine phosphosulfate reductase